jgi:subtilisin family serine protease
MHKVWSQETVMGNEQLDNLFNSHLAIDFATDYASVSPQPLLHQSDYLPDRGDLLLQEFTELTSIGQPVIKINSGDIIQSSPILNSAITSNQVSGNGNNLASNNLINLDKFQRDERFNGITGKGMSVVVIDTGINPNHPFFGKDQNQDGISDRLVYQYDFADRDSDARDLHGHGSHITSIIASEDVNYPGVVPNVDIIALKVFSDSGEGSFSYVEQALQWVINNATKYNIIAVNLSLGDRNNWTTATDPYNFNNEFATLNTMGITPVVSAGNEFHYNTSQVGVSGIAANDYVIGVGAVYGETSGRREYNSGAIAYSTGLGRIVPFSQRHDRFTPIFAPGAPIIGAGKDHNLLTMEGTSQSASLVTGAVVLAQQLALTQLNRYLTFSEVKEIIVNTGKTIKDGDDEDDNVKNTGLSFRQLDVFAMGEAILQLEPTLPTINLTAIDPIASEDYNQGVFRLTRTGVTNNSLQVNYRITGTATNGIDYEQLSGVAIFSPGSNTTTIVVKPIDDLIFEGNETVKLNLVNQSNYIVGKDKQATVTILDNDRPTVNIQTLSINDSQNHNQFTLIRTGNVDTGLTVYYRINATSPTGLYHTSSAKLIFTPGSDTATIDIKGILGKLAGGNDSIDLTLVSQSAYQLGTNKTARVKIIDSNIVPLVTNNFRQNTVIVNPPLTTVNSWSNSLVTNQLKPSSIDIGEVTKITTPIFNLSSSIELDEIIKPNPEKLIIKPTIINRSVELTDTLFILQEKIEQILDHPGLDSILAKGSPFALELP